MLAIILIIATVLLWGVAPILDKIALVNSDAWVAVIVRSWVVCVLATVFMFITGRTRTVFNTDLKTIGLFSASGIMMGFLAMLTFYYVLKLQPASKIIPLTSVYPLVAAVLGVIFLKEAFTIERFIGVGLIVAGVWLVK